MDATDARHELYEAMNADRGFEWKAERALELGEQYLGVDNAHLTKIHPDSDYWKAIASTDPPDGQFPPGEVLDLQTTYCRRVIEREETIALHDVPNQGWDDDPAFEAHGVHCYHGSPILVEGDLYGTVCFVSEDPRSDPFGDGETLFAELVARTLEHELRWTRTSAKVERLERFASVLSHDLRNPLTVAMGRIDIVRERTDSEHLDDAAAALDRIETIISDVLTMARQGEEVEDTEAVRLSSLVEECWSAVDTAEADLAVERECTVRADPDRLRHLFENLFRNAIEHGGREVTIRVGALADDEGFYVADDGSGIPADEHETVFESGYTTGSEGIGLGLAIVDGVVSAHDWTITVTESADGGSRFEIGDVAVLDGIQA